jgi:hypothetical protein
MGAEDATQSHQVGGQGNPYRFVRVFSCFFICLGLKDGHHRQLKVSCSLTDNKPPATSRPTSRSTTTIQAVSFFFLQAST